ncbi:FUSC family protein [Vibrio mediterranei]|uniref:FUSC family protein n=1 Tax=Vibrio mediterranei TaxID=689 RepID=UPI0022836012|nr:FUSC family protein [Vibrio mediterranei]MCY9856162.1 FUSC family protein [Vibrio mediterranei]
MFSKNSFIKKEFYLISFGILPSLSMYFFSGDSLYVKMALISTSLIITQLTLQCSFLLTFVQYLQIIFISIILCKIQDSLIAYSLFSSLVCAYYLNLTRYGSNLKIYASFIIVPAFYLSTEMNRLGVPETEIASTYMTHLPLSILPSIIISLLTKTSNNKMNFGGIYIEYNNSTISVFASVLICTLFSYYFNWQHSEWILWSAVSVCTGELSSMRAKVKHRLLGATVGITLGMIISFYTPNSDVLRYMSVALIPLTIPLKNYLFAFSTRCTLTVLSVGMISQIDEVAMYKVLSIYVGGFIGYLIGTYVIKVNLVDGNTDK